MTDQRPDYSVVARELALRIDDLVAWLRLAPIDKRQNEFWPLNPTRADRSPGSFVIYGSGNARAGGWVDYVDPDNLKGDALDLVAYITTGQSPHSNKSVRRDGYEQGLRFLGWESGAFLTLDHQRDQRIALERDRKEAEERAAGALREKRQRAFNGWLEDKPLSRVTRSWAYLTRRGVDMNRLEAEKRIPGALRHRTKEKHAETGLYYPCMTALITSPDGKPWSVHRTWLDHDGGKKAPVDPPRKIWPGGFFGGAIRLSKGAGNISPEKAASLGLTGDTLAIGEGVETMLSVALVCPEWRVWAAGTLGAIGHVIVPACVERVVIVGENNSAPQADEAFARVTLQLARQAQEKGFALYTVKPQAGDGDFNDTLQRLSRDVGAGSA